MIVFCSLLNYLFPSGFIPYFQISSLPGPLVTKVEHLEVLQSPVWNTSRSSYHQSETPPGPPVTKVEHLLFLQAPKWSISCSSSHQSGASMGSPVTKVEHLLVFQSPKWSISRNVASTVLAQDFSVMLSHIQYVAQDTMHDCKFWQTAPVQAAQSRLKVLT